MMNQEGELIQTLEEVFCRIHRERMAGLPILNPALAVQAVGFQAWLSSSVGILITPWLMSLVVLPSRHPGWDETPGTKVGFNLPAGPLEFTLTDEQGIGSFLSHSLFSPMSAFDSQEQAAEKATGIMNQLMRSREQEKAADPAPNSPGRRKLLRALFGANR